MHHEKGKHVVAPGEVIQQAKRDKILQVPVKSNHNTLRSYISLSTASILRWKDMTSASLLQEM